MNVSAYYKSLTKELESLKDRVRNFIARSHWLTDGEWKESVLRSIIARRLPDTVKVGRGFIITQQETSTQCDVLLYMASSPILFREGDLVFLTPDSVLAVIEVKSRATPYICKKAIAKLGQIGRLLSRYRTNCVLGLFAYESNIESNQILKIISKACNQEEKVVDLVSLGCSQFIKWWEDSPEGGNKSYKRWHSYFLPDMAAGYFITNLIDFTSPESIEQNNRLWFPEEGKEMHRTGKIQFTNI